MNVHMVDLLMCHPAVVLENVVLFGTAGSSNLCGERQKLAERVVRDISQFCAVMLWNDELYRHQISKRFIAYTFLH